MRSLLVVIITGSLLVLCWFSADREVDSVEEQEEQEELLEVSRRLITKEEQLFAQDCVSEEEEDQLQKDLEDLKLHIWMAVHDTFTSSQLDVLRSAVASIQQQETQDRRWTDGPEDRRPAWRPLKCLSTHNALLQNMVESRLWTAVEDGASELSSPVKREVSCPPAAGDRSRKQVTHLCRLCRCVAWGDE